MYNMCLSKKKKKKNGTFTLALLRKIDFSSVKKGDSHGGFVIPCVCFYICRESRQSVWGKMVSVVQISDDLVLVSNNSSIFYFLKRLLCIKYMQVGILFYTHKTDFKKRENIGTEFKRVINGALTRITNFIFVIHFTQSTLKYEKLIVNLTTKTTTIWKFRFCFFKKILLLY